MIFYAFDVLSLDGAATIALPYRLRRELLAAMDWDVWGGSTSARCNRRSSYRRPDARPGQAPASGIEHGYAPCADGSQLTSRTRG